MQFIFPLSLKKIKNWKIISLSWLYITSYSSQTGADGCICYLEYDKDRKNLEFIGMKQVKELSLVQSVHSAYNSSVNELSNCHYAAGFASVDFIIWNLLTETKVYSIPSHHTASSKMIYKLLVFFTLVPKSIFVPGLPNSMWWMAASSLLLSW